MNSRTPRHFRINDSGSSATEFALVLPLLAFLLFGFFEAGRLFWTYTIVSAAARDAGRYAARLSMSCSGLSASDLQSVKQLARTGTIDGSGDPLVKGWTNDNTVTVTVDCVSNSTNYYKGRYSGISQIPRVSVTAAAPYARPFQGLIPLNLTQISVTHAEVWTQ